MQHSEIKFQEARNSQKELQTEGISIKISIETKGFQTKGFPGDFHEDEISTFPKSKLTLTSILTNLQYSIYQNTPACSTRPIACSTAGVFY